MYWLFIMFIYGQIYSLYVWNYLRHLCVNQLTMQCGVTCTVRHRIIVTYRGLTYYELHAAHSHLFIYNSITYEVNIIGMFRVCSRRSWLSYGVGYMCYNLILHFLLFSRILGVLWMKNYAFHEACFHSFLYISATEWANVIGLLRACSKRSWLLSGVGENS